MCKAVKFTALNFWGYAGKGIRALARLRVAVFETAALPLGYPGIDYEIISIIKQIKYRETQNNINYNTTPWD